MIGICWGILRHLTSFNFKIQFRLGICPKVLGSASRDRLGDFQNAKMVCYIPLAIIELQNTNCHMHCSPSIIQTAVASTENYTSENHIPLPMTELFNH
jgi:hypothetical protein